MIRCINLVAVTCDGEGCQEVVVLKRWLDAVKLDWSAPIDGDFQLCPRCAKKRTSEVFEAAKLSKIAKKCPLAN